MRNLSKKSNNRSLSTIVASFAKYRFPIRKLAIIWIFLTGCAKAKQPANAPHLKLSWKISTPNYSLATKIKVPI